MIACLAALGLSAIFIDFAFLFFLPARWLLSYIIAIAEQLTELPYAYLEIDYLWTGWLAVYYGAAGWLIYKAGKNIKDTF